MAVSPFFVISPSKSCAGESDTSELSAIGTLVCLLICGVGLVLGCRDDSDKASPADWFPFPLELLCRVVAGCL